MPSSYKLHLNVLLHIMWDLLTAMYCNVTISVAAYLLWIRSWRVKKKDASASNNTSMKRL